MWCSVAAPMGPHIENTETSMRMPLKEEPGTFALEVGWLEPEVSESASARASDFPKKGAQVPRSADASPKGRLT